MGYITPEPLIVIALQEQEPSPFRLHWHAVRVLFKCRWRAAALATLVRIPEIQAHPLRITGKFPGYLSPSAGLKFADVPNGLAAISKAQWFFGFYLQEISQLGKR